MLYFAYGSNLSSVRLTARVPSAEIVTTAQLKGHRLLFHKIGRDGSAKCDACFTGLSQDVLFGAVYRIDPDQKKHLDQAEGLGNGYEIKHVKVITLPGKTIKAFTYYATTIDKTIKPFHWYKKHVLIGAEQHGFPSLYKQKISQIDSVNDYDLQRSRRELDMYPKKQMPNE